MAVTSEFTSSPKTVVDGTVSSAREWGAKGSPWRVFATKEPIMLADGTVDCEWGRAMHNVDSGLRLVVRCGSAARARCGPCSVRYRRRVGRIFVSGCTDSDPNSKVWALTAAIIGAR